MVFKKISDVVDYLDTQLPWPEASVLSNTKLVDIMLPVFVCDLMHIPENILEVCKKFQFKTLQSLPTLLSTTANMHSHTLTITQFHVLCGIRGPINTTNFEKEIVKKTHTQLVQKYAKHKDFPIRLKYHFYETTGNTEYLPQEAQDIFVFFG